MSAAATDVKVPLAPRRVDTTPLDGLQDGDQLTDLHPRDLDLSSRTVEGIDVERCHLQGVNLAATQLTGVRLDDVTFETCDLAGAVFSDVRLLRVRFVGCRMTGFVLDALTGTDLTISASTAKGMAILDGTLRRVLVEDTDLAGADLRGLRLTEGSVLRSNLGGADLGGATISADFERCTLDVATGAAGLRGSRVDGVSLLSLAPALAAAAGISPLDR